MVSLKLAIQAILFEQLVAQCIRESLFRLFFFHKYFLGGLKMSRSGSHSNNRQAAEELGSGCHSV